MGETFFITVHWSPPATPGAPVRGVAQWDLLRVESGTQQQPSARCYHAAALYGSAADPRMLVFGGAGEGSTLFNDVWTLAAEPAGGSKAAVTKVGGGGKAGAPTMDSLAWCALEPLNDGPAGRSSHLCGARAHAPAPPH
eukprot:6245300-Prymnesium_polylepis.4